MWFDNQSASCYFHYDLCVNLDNQFYPPLVVNIIYLHFTFALYICSFSLCSFSLVTVNRTIHTIPSSPLRAGLKLCGKSEGLAYENAENQYPRCTIAQSVCTTNSKSLTEALVKAQPIKVSSSCIDDNVCIDAVQKYFTADA